MTWITIGIVATVAVVYTTLYVVAFWDLLVERVPGRSQGGRTPGAASGGR